MKNDLTAEQLQQPITVTLPLGVVLNINGNEDSVFVHTSAPRGTDGLPTIGHPLQNGIFAGLSLEDERPVALILLPGDIEADWNKAAAWAKEQGGALPSRIDQLVLFKNLKRELKEEAYWSDTPLAGDDADAWYQLFNGSQGTSLKVSKLRARAVRRIAI
jgi:hypothetical protein